MINHSNYFEKIDREIKISEKKKTLFFKINDFFHKIYKKNQIYIIISKFDFSAYKSHFIHFSNFKIKLQNFNKMFNNFFQNEYFKFTNEFYIILFEILK